MVITDPAVSRALRGVNIVVIVFRGLGLKGLMQ